MLRSSTQLDRFPLLTSGLCKIHVLQIDSRVTQSSKSLQYTLTKGPKMLSDSLHSFMPNPENNILTLFFISSLINLYLFIFSCGLIILSLKRWTAAVVVTCKVKFKLSYEHLEENMGNVETRFVTLIPIFGSPFIPNWTFSPTKRSLKIISPLNYVLAGFST